MRPPHWRTDIGKTGVEKTNRKRYGGIGRRQCLHVFFKRWGRFDMDFVSGQEPTERFHLPRDPFISVINHLSPDAHVEIVHVQGAEQAIPFFFCDGKGR